jgi:uncharacterized RDD family membrane protein YckC
MDDVRPAINPYSAPEAPIAHAPTAGTFSLASRWRRLGANLIDTLLIGVCAVPAAIASKNVTRGSRADDSLGLLVAGLMVALCIVQVVLLARSSQTLGKKALAIRIVRSDGSAAGLGRTFGIRYVLASLLGIVPFFSLVDILFIFGNDRRCIHDHMADTIVVDV